jgi:solute carrier family 8 (sodium/calcium exchanger)
MELDGCKACFEFIMTTAGLAIPVFISDRHRGICKYVRECHPGIKHYFDQWHVAKGLVKKMISASKEKGCGRIKEWTKGMKNHLYWCSTSTVEDFQEMILAKWKSFMGHVANKHDNHADPLFPKCLHEENIPKRKWIKIGKMEMDFVHN